MSTYAQKSQQQSSPVDLFNTLMTRVLDRNGHNNYKTVSDDVPEHLHALEIERRQFIKWIADYQLPIGLKLQNDLHMYDGVTDPSLHIVKWHVTCFNTP